MRPVILEISGLNSYIKTQKIDFSRLTARGLFGITGPIGSGKSTILDAITLALYGKTERGRKSCVNVECDKAQVRFTFEIGGKPRRRYCIEKTFKRNTDGGVNAVKARLMLENSDGSHKVLEDKAKSIDEAVVKILGLTYDDFTRSVVLPQGKFSEFLTLPKKDRNTMLERIFSLEEYGNRLREKLKARHDDARLKLNGIQSALSAYQDVSEENMNVLVKKRDEYAAEIENLQKKLDDTNRVYFEKKKIWEYHLEYSEYLTKRQKLLLMREDIRDKETALSRGQQADFLMPFIEAEKGLTERYDAANKQYIEVQERVLLLEKQAERAKQSYDELVVKKRAEYEPLLQKRLQLKEAEGMLSEASVILQQRDKLRNDYAVLASAAESDRIALGGLLVKRESLEGELLKLAEEKRLLQVTPEMRGEVSRGLRAEEETADAAKRLNELRERIVKGEGVYNETFVKLEAARSKTRELREAINSKTAEMDLLASNLPATTESILKMQQEISVVKNTHKNAVAYREKIIQMTARIEGLETTLVKLCEKLEVAVDNQKASAETLNRLRRDKEGLERMNLASLLSAALVEGQPCPVCGSERHPNPAQTIAESLVSAIEEKISDAQEKDAEYVSGIQELRIAIAAHEKQRERETSQLAIMIDEIVNTTGGESDDDIAEKLIVMEKEFAETGKRLEKWEGDRRRSEGELHAANEAYNRYRGDLIKFTESLSKTTELLESLKEDERATEKQYDEYAQGFEALRCKWRLESFGDLQREIQEKDAKRPMLESREQQISKELAENNKARENLTDKLNAAVTELEQIKITGKEKSARFNELQERIEKISEGKNTADYLAAVEREITELLSSERSTEEVLAAAQKELSVEQANQIKLQKQSELLLEQREKAIEKCAEELRRAGFNKSEEVSLMYIPAARQKEMQTEISSYTDKLKETESNIARVSALIDGKQTTEDEVLSLAENIKQQAQQLQSAVESRAVNAASIKRMSEDLAASELLRGQEIDVRHEYELLLQLKSLFEGNAFIEYISQHELRYITTEASRRLKSVTHGRYGLEFDGEDFVIRDDAWGGKRRPVSSLSGGELFLTSLSLAIALSSKIQLKSAVLEFFFLDEGFGSLDSATLEVVMDSLERLKDETLCVGLITHVEEIKNRLPIRLEISPGTAGTGATVSVEV